MKSVSTQTSILINGKRYDSLADVPSEFRQFIEDKDNNGVPDFVEDTVAQAQQEVARAAQSGTDSGNNTLKNVVSVQSKFVINGKEYESLSDIPAFAATFKQFPFTRWKTKTSEKTDVAPASFDAEVPVQTATAKNREEKASVTVVVVLIGIVLLVGLYLALQ